MANFAQALEKSRVTLEQMKILRLTNSRTLRKQIIHMIESIQHDEYKLTVTPETNMSIFRAEEYYYYKRTCNFWYAVDREGAIIGCIGLKILNDQQAEIRNLFIAADYRGLGVAQFLLQHLVKSSLKHGFQFLFIATTDQLPASRPFFLKCGFQEIKVAVLPKQFSVGPMDTDFYFIHTTNLEKNLEKFI